MHKSQTESGESAPIDLSLKREEESIDVIASTICFSRALDVLIGGNDDHTLKTHENGRYNQYRIYHKKYTKKSSWSQYLKISFEF